MRGTCRLLTVILGACWAICAQSPGPGGGYRIAGRVVDTITGAPVSRATVNLMAGEQYNLTASVLTDAEGRFAFDHVAAGKYPLSAAKRGYRTSYYDEHEDFNSAIVTGEGQETSNLVFRLAPAAMLRGVVTDDAGDPVENAQVMLFKRPAHGENGGRMQQAAGAPTDDSGTYEFSDLAPGEYYVAVKAEPWYAQHGAQSRGGAREQSPLDVAYPITYYDSTVDEGAATPVTLNWGSREEADINLHAMPAIRFRVPLLTPKRNDSPPIRLQQRVFGNVAYVQNMTTVSGAAGGILEISGLAPGSYDVEIGNPPRHMIVNAASDADLDPNAGSPTVSVAGRLIMTDGGRVPEHLTVELAAPETGNAPGVTNAQSGNFEFKSVPPGTWTVAVGGPQQSLAVVGTAVGRQLTAGDKIEVRDRPLSLAIVLSRAQVRVEGFARRDGKGVPGAMVLLVPRDPGLYPGLVRRDQSDSDGSFSLRDVPAGQYTAVAIENGWKLDWQRRDVIEPYLRGGVAITVPEQGGIVVNLQRAVQAAVAK